MSCSEAIGGGMRPGEAFVLNCYRPTYFCHGRALPVSACWQVPAVYTSVVIHLNAYTFDRFPSRTTK